MNKEEAKLAMEFGKVLIGKFEEQSEMMAKAIMLAEVKEAPIGSGQYMLFSLMTNLEHFNEAELAAMATVFLHKYAKLKMELDNDESQA